MLKIYRVPQSLRNSETIPGGMVLCKKVPAQCDFVIEIADDMTLMLNVLRFFDVKLDIQCVSPRILLRFFREDKMHAVDSITLSFTYKGVQKYVCLCNRRKLNDLCGFIHGILG